VSGKAVAGDKGWGLACVYCGHLFPMTITVAVMAAHFQVEPGHQPEPKVELVALCPRCGKAMKHRFKVGHRHYFDCEPCYRRRVVTQLPPGFR
jgi:5-methylcytosine-specific restriction endonuclease McrA